MEIYLKKGNEPEKRLLALFELKKELRNTDGVVELVDIDANGGLHFEINTYGYYE